MAKEKKRPKFEREDLVEMLYLKLLEGESRYRLKLMLERDNFKDQDGNTIKSSAYSRTSHYNFIAEAYDKCHTELKENRDVQRNVLWERILSTYNDAFNNHDRANALKALDMMAKMGGLYEPDRVDVNANVDHKVTVSFGVEETPSEEEEEDIVF